MAINVRSFFRFPVLLVFLGGLVIHCYSAEDTAFEEDSGLGIDGFTAPPPGRSDVQTTLGLSPWELYVLSDLAFKVTSKQCPKISPELITSMQDMLTDSFKQAPTPVVQNQDFLSNYNDFVKCMDYVQEKGQLEPPALIQPLNTASEKVVTEKAQEEEKEEVKSSESDWIANEATSSTTPEPEPVPTLEEDRDESGWLWSLGSFNKWIKDFFRSKREVDEEREKEMTQKREKELKEERKRRKELIYQRARQNFANLFHSMSKIVRKSCPKSLRPDTTFMRQVFLDMTAWATLERQETISAGAKYFQKHEMLKSMLECYKSL